MALRKCAIKDLSNDKIGICVTGLVIGKNEPRSFEMANIEVRSVLTLTLRDSKRHFINCNIWGSPDFIDIYNDRFTIGQLVVLNNPRISTKTTDNERFQPLTSSPFNLTVQEGNASCELADDDICLELKNEAIKSTSNALALADVQSLGRNANGNFVDLLVIVRSVQQIRTIETRNGPKSVREVIVMDQTQEFTILSIWGGEYLKRAALWKPFETTLHLVNVLAKYTDFRKMVQLSLNSRTIIIENPINSAKSMALLNYVHSITLAALDSVGARAKIDLATIKEVMTIQKIQDMIEGRIPAEDEFTALLFAVIAQFDVDQRPTTRHCVKCNQFVSRAENHCCNKRCIQASGSLARPFIEKFNMAVSLIDHTGTLNNCRLISDEAEHVLQMSLEGFQHLNDRQIQRLRWTYLLERFAIKMLVKTKAANRSKVFIQILDIADVNCSEAIPNMKVY